MLVFRAIVALTMLLLPFASSCSASSEADLGACAACQHEYATCSFPNLQEGLAVEIRERDSHGCSGVVQGAPMHIVCEPLQFCWDNLSTCYPVKYSEGTLRFDDGGVCG